MSKKNDGLIQDANVRLTTAKNMRQSADNAERHR